MAPLSSPNMCGLHRWQQMGGMLPDEIKVGRDDTGLETQKMADLGMWRAMFDE